jgi:hypothetical protein
MAELLKEYGGKIVSFEQSESYYESVQKHFPDSLRETADLRLANVNLDWFGSYRGIYYDFEPPAEVDLVYIDGATRTRGNEESNFVYRRLNADLIRMHLAGTKIGHAITDHRWAIYPFYKDQLPGYNIKYSRWWKSIIIDPIN